MSDYIFEIFNREIFDMKPRKIRFEKCCDGCPHDLDNGCVMVEFFHCWHIGHRILVHIEKGFSKSIFNKSLIEEYLI